MRNQGLVIFTIFLICSILLTGLESNNGAKGASTINSTVLRSDTVWTKAGSPYEFSGPVAIGEGVTLSIEPGTVIELNGYYLQVNGTLHAVGSLTDPILFNGTLGDYYHPVGNQHIDFMPTSTDWNQGSGSIIENAVLKYTNININSASPKISYNTMQSILINGGSPIISNNRLIEYQGPIASIVIESGNPTISDNNEIRGISVHGGSVQIINNNITSSGNGGTEFNTAVYISGGTSTIKNNYIYSMTVDYAGDLYRPATVYTYPGIIIQSEASVTNNCITGCSTGIEVSASATIEGNSILKSKTGIKLTAAYSGIHYNNIEGNSIYSVYITTSQNIDMTNNWWGTTDQSKIDTSIFDAKDDFSLGEVTYTPFLDSPNAEAPIERTTPNEATPQPTSTQTPIVTPSYYNHAETASPSAESANNVSNIDSELIIILALTGLVIALLVIIAALLYQKKK